MSVPSASAAICCAASGLSTTKSRRMPADIAEAGGEAERRRGGELRRFERGRLDVSVLFRVVGRECGRYAVLCELRAHVGGGDAFVGCGAAASAHGVGGEELEGGTQAARADV